MRTRKLPSRIVDFIERPHEPDTLNEALARFLGMKRKNLSTAGMEHLFYSLYPMTEALGNPYMSGLTPEDVDKYIDSLPHKPTSIRNISSDINQFFRWVRHGVLDYRKVKPLPPKSIKPVIVYLSAQLDHLVCRDALGSLQAKPGMWQYADQRALRDLFILVLLCETRISVNRLIQLKTATMEAAVSGAYTIGNRRFTEATAELWKLWKKQRPPGADRYAVVSWLRGEAAQPVKCVKDISQALGRRFRAAGVVDSFNLGGLSHAIKQTGLPCRPWTNAAEVPPTIKKRWPKRGGRHIENNLTEAARAASLNPGGLLDISPRTLQGWLETMRNLSYFLENDQITITEVTAAMLLDWHEWQQQQVTAVSANNRLRALRVIYNRLIKRGLASDNPASYVPYAPEDPHIPEGVSRATYDAMRESADVRGRAILAILWLTGCRIGEVASIRTDTLETWLHKEDENDPGRWRLMATIKGKYHRRLSVKKATRNIYGEGPEVLDVKQWLKERPFDAPYLFTNRTGENPISVHALSSIMRDIRIAAGIDPHETTSNAHAFRHGFVYRKQKEGYPIEWISQWVGHSDPFFTARVYGDRSDREIMRRFFSPPPRR